MNAPLKGRTYLFLSVQLAIENDQSATQDESPKSRVK